MRVHHGVGGMAMTAMLRFRTSFNWRRAIGLIAAYVLVVQSTLAIGLVTRAATPGDSSFSGMFFVICSGADEAAAQGDTGAPVTHATHCPVCILAASAGGIAPYAMALPVLQAVTAAPISTVAAANGVSPHYARAGLSRAPPATV